MLTRTHHSRTALAAVALALAACRTAGAPGPARSSTIARAEAEARAAIADEQAIRPASLPAHSVGVAPLRLAARDTALAPLAYGLADLLLADLAVSRQLVVVDRVRLDVLVREIRLAGRGLVDSATAPRVGRLVGARRLVLGTLAVMPDGRLRIDGRLADVATGQVQSVVSGSTPLADVIAAEKEVAFRILAQLGVTLTPAERAAIALRPTRDVGALLAYGRAVRFEVEGRYDLAARESERALQRDPDFTRAGARLRAVRALGTPTPPPSAQAATAAHDHRVTLAALDAVERVNRSLGSLVPMSSSRVADAAFPQSSTLVITVRVRP
ncbi:MAG: CsgG/HfaB family protein [Gemmatirosa sp.]